MYALKIITLTAQSLTSINGIATTTSGHKKALARLESIFKRPIVGINNKSLGVIADLAECLVQRDLRWPTDDIRQGYNVIRTGKYS